MSERLQCTVFTVPDRETADYWANLAREQGVLVSRDGNTLTISAPIVIPRPTGKATGDT